MSSSEGTPPIPASFPACPHCGTRYVGNDTTCGTCGHFLPIAYTGPTQRLEDARPVLNPIQPAAPALPAVDAQTERAILAELARTNNHQEAARLVIDAYQCHWDVALQIVATVEQQHATAQAAHKPAVPSKITIMMLSIVLFVLLLMIISHLFL